MWKKILNNNLKKSFSKIYLIKVNEAFAAQVLAVQRELKVEADRLNINGGAIAIGHPLGASGARISAHLVHELKLVFLFLTYKMFLKNLSLHIFHFKI